MTIMIIVNTCIKNTYNDSYFVSIHTITVDTKLSDKNGARNLFQ